MSASPNAMSAVSDPMMKPHTSSPAGMSQPHAHCGTKYPNAATATVMSTKRNVRF